MMFNITKTDLECLFNAIYIVIEFIQHFYVPSEFMIIGKSMRWIPDSLSDCQLSNMGNYAFRRVGVT